MKLKSLTFNLKREYSGDFVIIASVLVIIDLTQVLKVISAGTGISYCSTEKFY